MIRIVHQPSVGFSNCFKFKTLNFKHLLKLIKNEKV